MDPESPSNSDDDESEARTFEVQIVNADGVPGRTAVHTADIDGFVERQVAADMTVERVVPIDESQRDE